MANGRLIRKITIADPVLNQDRIGSPPLGFTVDTKIPIDGKEYRIFSIERSKKKIRIFITDGDEAILWNEFSGKIVMRIEYFISK